MAVHKILSILHSVKRSSVVLCLILVSFFALILFFEQLTKPAPTFAQTVPQGFQESVVFSGLSNPTAVRFASDGRVFVAEKSGLIKVFDNLQDTTPTIFADLRTNVHNFWDRGLLGLALDPDFPSKPYVYVLYTFDAAIGGTPPRWGSPNADSDGCPDPPGATGAGCVVSARLSRLQAAGNNMTGTEQVLIEDWCQQYPSHSIGSLVFGQDGALYASAGDGASFTFGDWGQNGDPPNPCGDPPQGVGSAQTPPTAEGGALRSQDLRTSGDPVTLDGSVIRINPDTGAAMPNNPFINESDANAKRIIAYGLRNPFRITMRPGTNEVWLGDVGWGAWEEINRIVSPIDATVENFGWPCYEGNVRQETYDGSNLNLCENLYSEGGITYPYFTYNHNDKIVPNESCSVGSSSVSGVAFQFYPGGPYPQAYDGALFFADYSRNCIWAMKAAGSGLPNIAAIETFVAQAKGPVDLQVSPQGELFYVDFDGGTIRKISYGGTSPSPLPSPWQTQDIGAVGVVGSATLNNNIFTIKGSGTDIWDQSDEFQYVYQPLTGDGTITARVTSLDNTNPWAKAGVMIRESLTGESKHAFAAVTSGNGTAFQRRASVGDISYHSAGSSVTTPYWVKLERKGDVFSAFQSSDGSAWSPINAEIVAMAQNVYVGLAVTSHNNSIVTTATFSNVQVITAAANQPPVPTISSPTSSFNWKVGDTISFTGSGTDPEDGTLPATALRWDVTLYHCPTNCHTHAIQSFTGVSSGSFAAADHDYPSYLELKVTATDSNNNQSSTTVKLDPQTVPLTFQTNPSGLQLVAGTGTSTTPFTKTVIVTSNVAVTATSPQTVNSKTYNFVQWSNNGAMNHSIVAPATATTYTATYQEIQTTNGLNATYYDNLDFSGTSVTRVDPTIDFDWGFSSPNPAISPDTFVASWVGQVDPQYSQTYTFYTNSDDGVRLWVDNQLIINKWNDQSATQYSATISLTAGKKVNIKMEFYDNTEDATAQLSWSAASQPKEIIPQSRLTPTYVPPADGLRAIYYDNKDLTGKIFSRIDPTVNFNWGSGSPNDAIGRDTFSTRWTGFVVPQHSQTYTFYTNTNDGVRLWVNDTLIINKWVNQSARQWTGTIALTAGKKTKIKMEYFENTTTALAQLSWSSPSQPKQIIPQSQLYADP